ncbi:MAG: hypothetical protein LBS60_08625 [Deltaproteobacteria bacterium]|nr:hypothetical protein [Deltaproteobacteria bacterium]
MIFLFGLSFSLINFTYYSRLAAVWPPGPLGGVIFLDLAFLAMALGGLWWGDSIKGESAATSPLLAITLIAGSFFFLVAPFLLPASSVSRLITQSWGGYFGGRIWMALLVILPGFFLWGAAPPFLTALAFPQERGLASGVFSIFSLTLIAMALGAVALWWWPTEVPIWLERLIGLPCLPILIIGLKLWAKTPLEDRKNLPFWPSPSMGLWTGEKVYGLDILITPRRARTLTPALFLGTIAATMAVTIWLLPFFTSDQAPVWTFAPHILVFLALGALAWGPLLAAIASPMAALGLDFFFLGLILFLGPNPPALLSSSWLSIGGILISLGAIWPLGARISLIRYGFIPSGLGHVNIWFLGGALIGLTVTVAFLSQHPHMAASFYQIAFASSLLALAITWNWLWGLLVLVGLGLGYFLF